MAEVDCYSLPDSDLEIELESLEAIFVNELTFTRKEDETVDEIELLVHPATGHDPARQYVCMKLVFRPSPKYPHEVPEIEIRNPRGLGEEEIESLVEDMKTKAEECRGEVMLYTLIEMAKDSLTEGNVPHCPCIVCLEHFSSDDSFHRTACYHYFHTHCLHQYLEHTRSHMEEERKTRLEEDKNRDASNGKNFQIMCPLCREPLDESSLVVTCDVIQTEEEERFVPPPELREQQLRMAEMFEMQKAKGGIIDLEAEKNRFLINPDTLVPIRIPTPVPRIENERNQDVCPPETADKPKQGIHSSMMGEQKRSTTDALRKNNYTTLRGGQVRRRDEKRVAHQDKGLSASKNPGNQRHYHNMEKPTGKVGGEAVSETGEKVGRGRRTPQGRDRGRGRGGGPRHNRDDERQPGQPPSSHVKREENVKSQQIGEDGQIRGSCRDERSRDWMDNQREDLKEEEQVRHSDRLQDRLGQEFGEQHQTTTFSRSGRRMRGSRGAYSGSGGMRQDRYYSRDWDRWERSENGRNINDEEDKNSERNLCDKTCESRTISQSSTETRGQGQPWDHERAERGQGTNAVTGVDGDCKPRGEYRSRRYETGKSEGNRQRYRKNDDRRFAVASKREEHGDGFESGESGNPHTKQEPDGRRESRECDEDLSSSRLRDSLQGERDDGLRNWTSKEGGSAGIGSTGRGGANGDRQRGQGGRRGRGDHSDRGNKQGKRGGYRSGYGEHGARSSGAFRGDHHFHHQSREQPQQHQSHRRGDGRQQVEGRQRAEGDARPSRGHARTHAGSSSQTIDDSPTNAEEEEDVVGIMRDMKINQQWRQLAFGRNKLNEEVGKEEMTNGDDVSQNFWHCPDTKEPDASSEDSSPTHSDSGYVHHVSYITALDRYGQLEEGDIWEMEMDPYSFERRHIKRKDRATYDKYKQPDQEFYDKRVEERAERERMLYEEERRMRREEEVKRREAEAKMKSQKPLRSVLDQFKQDKLLETGKLLGDEWQKEQYNSIEHDERSLSQSSEYDHSPKQACTVNDKQGSVGEGHILDNIQFISSERRGLGSVNMTPVNDARGDSGAVKHKASSKVKGTEDSDETLWELENEKNSTRPQQFKIPSSGSDNLQRPREESFVDEKIHIQSNGDDAVIDSKIDASNSDRQRKTKHPNYEDNHINDIVNSDGTLVCDDEGMSSGHQNQVLTTELGKSEKHFEPKIGSDIQDWDLQYKNSTILCEQEFVEKKLEKRKSDPEVSFLQTSGIISRKQIERKSNFSSTNIRDETTAMPSKPVSKDVQSHNVKKIKPLDFTKRRQNITPSCARPNAELVAHATDVNISYTADNDLPPGHVGLHQATDTDLNRFFSLVRPSDAVDTSLGNAFHDLNYFQAEAHLSNDHVAVLNYIGTNESNPDAGDSVVPGVHVCATNRLVMNDTPQQAGDINSGKFKSENGPLYSGNSSGSLCEGGMGNGPVKVRSHVVGTFSLSSKPRIGSLCDDSTRISKPVRWRETRTGDEELDVCPLPRSKSRGEKVLQLLNFGATANGEIL